ncbi:DUF817 domain-containing protein [Brevibacillus fluminis]|uniref:DUF817 domain-containing protein n=1 Tax=Brevibacillus fluminis TaxID=511487 RepID=A0A3M8DAG9_9BACL|nr:DUF817 domain-containing protein [Brevibacillus fluminis]RNB85140.1 DUF817 domain-containing protein [Brevibacillus fluminis]
MKRAFVLLLHFGYQEAMSCLFPVSIFLALALTHLIDNPIIPRYDLLLLWCLAMQIFMVKSGLETKDELKVITLFHLIGLLLELFKTHMGSWSYPDAGYSKIAGVPLYSGFMYASVASYLCQAWRRLDVSITGWPRAWFTVPLGAAIYLNFFTHHFIGDFRWILTALMFVIFLRTRVHFIVRGEPFRMPLALSFFLIGFFIWIAENIATLFGAWTYPNQHEGWQLVSLSKISSWFLLIIVSFIIVAQLKHVKGKLSQETKGHGITTD